MKAKWWSCVLGLLCMPAGVILDPWTAFQSPSSISNVRVNSSLEIRCTTTLESPVGLSLKRHFLKDEQILYLSFGNGDGFKDTKAEKFKNRTGITREQPNQGVKYSFKLQLSLLGLEDTDLYYCRWTYFDEVTYRHIDLDSNGTVIIVREDGPVTECSNSTVDLTLICLSIAACTTILLIFVGAVMVRCTRFKKRFTPGRPYAPPLPPRPPRPPRPSQPQHPYLQQQNVHHCPYMMTSTNNYGSWGNL
ncbi:uncharacterized protein V3H82_000706 [Fundulus diaphanus]